jgi:hypothetical protein
VPGTHRIYSGHRLAVIRLTGVIRGSDLFDVLHRMLSDSRWSAGFNGVIDVRDTEEVNLGIEDVQRFVDLLNTHRDRLGRRTAVIVTRPLVQMAAVLYAAIARETIEAVQVEVFRDARSAGEWLGLGRHDIDHLLDIGALAA